MVRGQDGERGGWRGRFGGRGGMGGKGVEVALLRDIRRRGDRVWEAWVFSE